MGPITLPGIVNQCIVCEDMQGTDHEDRQTIYMTFHTYDALLRHGCVAFTMIEKPQQRLNLRTAGVVMQFYMSNEFNELTLPVTGNAIYQYRVTQYTSPRSILTGGILIGFKTIEDAALFKLTYM